MTDPQHEETFADTERKLREIITTLRAQLAEALFERDAVIAVRDMFGDRWANEKARADRAEAALAAQIEVDAGIALSHCYAIMSATDADARATMIHRAIITQPHDRTALDRYREKVLREAAQASSRYNVNRGQGSATARAITTAILAMIDKEKTK